ncbi:hypothetical protein OV079_51110 [Nannocystis pusilla]|uniref:Uncharacterized protein n=1 Tax=Nannocystis pusilla TaxID=889268 RepID=A0A9X3F0W2_9BACT|nr:hypothetical protein [Nannocystis pusilla]MCY1013741.1 hypothetical protein [Nannocystis pusilla]
MGVAAEDVHDEVKAVDLAVVDDGVLVAEVDREGPPVGERDLMDDASIAVEDRQPSGWLSAIEIEASLRSL